MNVKKEFTLHNHKSTEYVVARTKNTWGGSEEKKGASKSVMINSSFLNKHSNFFAIRADSIQTVTLHFFNSSNHNDKTL